jgi:hypothetical protein
MLFEQIIGIVSSHVLNAFKVGGGSLSCRIVTNNVGPRRRQRAPVPAVAAPCANSVSPVACAARYWERTCFCSDSPYAPAAHLSLTPLHCSFAASGTFVAQALSSLSSFHFPPHSSFSSCLLFLPHFSSFQVSARAFAFVISQLPSCASCCTMRVARCVLCDARCVLHDACYTMRVV